jgi:hypothetical protein
MKLTDITRDGNPTYSIADLPDVATDVLRGTAEMFQTIGYQVPWVGYLAFRGSIHMTGRSSPPPCGSQFK